MKIQEVELVTGLDRTTVRFYESEGLVIPQRLDNGYRSYCDQDIDLLLKIKLLRKLGLSLQQIQQLQNEQEDFSKILSQQIQKIEMEIQQDTRIKEVCLQMQREKAQYRSLDAAHYLDLLQSEGKEAPKAFREPLEEEPHPWLRYFARRLDMALLYAIICFIIVVGIRLRPISGAVMQPVLMMLSAALLIPVEAFMLHRWGTTPGKWIFGIHVEAKEGRYLTFAEALQRSKQIYIRGMGLGIPVAMLICNVLAYCRLTGRSYWHFTRYDQINYPEDMSWDQETEITYEDVRGKWLALPLALILGLSWFSITDSVKPKYRGEHLSVSEFAKNYNSFLPLTDSGLERLNADGTARITEGDAFTIYMGATPEKKHTEFTYETDNGILTSLRYNNRWSDVSYMEQPDIECFYAAVSMLLAQKGTGQKDLEKFKTLWDTHNGMSKADFTYSGIRIQWEYHLINSTIRENGSIVRTDEAQPASVEFECQIQF